MIARVIAECFDALYTTDCSIDPPSMVGNVLSVPVTGVLTLGSPFANDAGSLAGMFIFTGVASSSRTMVEYIGDPTNPDGFKDPYELDDFESE